MSKVLFMILSGEEAKEKANYGITMASRSLEAQRYDDLKVLFFGPSEEYITKLTGEPLEHLKKLIAAGAVDSACTAIAKKKAIEKPLIDLGLTLKPAGQQTAHYVNEGYQVITF